MIWLTIVATYDKGLDGCDDCWQKDFNVKDVFSVGDVSKEEKRFTQLDR